MSLPYSFMDCLRKNNMDNSKCRELSRAYLQCRMENNLMLKEDWKSLGYNDADTSQTDPQNQNDKS